MRRSTIVDRLRLAARLLAELACIALFVAMVWTWAALGAGA